MWLIVFNDNRISIKMMSSYYFSLPQPFLFVFLITVVDDKVEVYAVTHCVLVMHVGPSVITPHQHSSKHRSPKNALFEKKSYSKKNLRPVKKNCADVLKKIHTLSHATIRRRERKGISIISPMIMTFCHREAYIYIC